MLFRSLFYALSLVFVLFVILAIFSLMGCSQGSMPKPVASFDGKFTESDRIRETYSHAMHYQYQYFTHGDATRTLWDGKYYWDSSLLTYRLAQSITGKLLGAGDVNYIVLKREYGKDTYKVSLATRINANGEYYHIFGNGE